MTVDASTQFSYFRFSPHFEKARRLYFIRTFHRLPQDRGTMNGYGDKQVPCSLLTDRLPQIQERLQSMQLTETTVDSDAILVHSLYKNPIFYDLSYYSFLFLHIQEVLTCNSDMTR